MLMQMPVFMAAGIIKYMLLLACAVVMHGSRLFQPRLQVCGSV
jgi:hypothetical protein